VLQGLWKPGTTPLQLEEIILILAVLARSLSRPRIYKRSESGVDSTAKISPSGRGKRGRPHATATVQKAQMANRHGNVSSEQHSRELYSDYNAAFACAVYITSSEHALREHYMVQVIQAKMCSPVLCSIQYAQALF
jgi:hypothetical protein